MVHANNKLFLSGYELALKLVVVCALSGPALLLAVPNSDFNPTQTSTVKVKDVGYLSGFSLETAFEFSQRIAKDEKAKRQESMDLSIGVGYKINDTFKASVRGVLSKDNTEADDTQVSDTRVGLAVRGFQLNPSLMTLHSLSGIIPTSQRSKEQDRLQGAVSLSNGLHYAGSILDCQYRLGLGQNFHEYDFNAVGSANIEHTISHSLSTQIRITEKFYLSSLGVYRWAQTYGKKEKSFFEMHGDLNYDLTNKMTLNFGTSNAGQAFKANGVESNITAYNEDSAVIRAGISIVL